MLIFSSHLFYPLFFWFMLNITSVQMFLGIDHALAALAARISTGLGGSHIGPAIAGWAASRVVYKIVRFISILYPRARNDLSHSTGTCAIKSLSARVQYLYAFILPCLEFSQAVLAKSSVAIRKVSSRTLTSHHIEALPRIIYPFVSVPLPSDEYGVPSFKQKTSFSSANSAIHSG